MAFIPPIYVNIIQYGGTDLVCNENTFNRKTGSATFQRAIIFVPTFPTRAQGYNYVSSAAVFVTENHGMASITSGTTGITVSHGLAITLDQMSVTPQSSFGSANKFWISEATSTHFTSNVNPRATVTFGWTTNVGH